MHVRANPNDGTRLDADTLAPVSERIRARGFTGDIAPSDPELAELIVELMDGAPLPIAATSIRRLNTRNGVGAFGLCELPVLLLRAPLAPQPEALRSRQIKPDLEVGITVGGDHSHHLEVPEQVNAMIERFLKIRV